MVSAALLAGGCDRLRPQPAEPPVELELSGAAPSADTSDLAAVLAAAVTDDGRVRPEPMRQMSARLDAALRRLAVTGPTATPGLYPTYGARWAYWYNARAAWSMKLALLCGCPRATDAAPFRARRFPLDGREMSLEAVDALLLAEAKRSGDFRLAACAPGVMTSHGPMPSRPVTAADFGEGLSAMLSRLVLDERRFVVDVEAREVRVPLLLWAARGVLQSAYRRQYGGGEVALTTALRPFVSDQARGRLEETLGYEAAAAAGGELAIPRRKVFYPGKIGRVEPP